MKDKFWSGEVWEHKLLNIFASDFILVFAKVSETFICHFLESLNAFLQMEIFCK